MIITALTILAWTALFLLWAGLPCEPAVFYGSGGLIVAVLLYV